MKYKLWTWIKRYGPAEITGTLGAIAGGNLVLWLTENPIAAAYGGSICLLLLLTN